MDPETAKLIFGYGVLGAFTLLWLIGWIEAKPHIEERKTREREKDVIIQRQANALERIADKLEAKQ